LSNRFLHGLKTAKSDIRFPQGRVPIAPPASPALPRPANAGAALGQATSRSRFGAWALTSPGRVCPCAHAQRQTPAVDKNESLLTTQMPGIEHGIY
jgi:hypothetical protein